MAHTPLLHAKKQGRSSRNRLKAKRLGSTKLGTVWSRQQERVAWVIKLYLIGQLVQLLLDIVERIIGLVVMVVRC